MPHSYAPQFRAMIVDRVRSGSSVAEVAASLEVAESTAYRWVRQDRIDRGELAGTSTVDNAQLREARRRIAELESELAVVKRASALFDEGRVVRPKAVFDIVEALAVRATAPSGSAASCGSRRRVSSGGGASRRRAGRSAGRGSPT